LIDDCLYKALKIIIIIKKTKERKNARETCLTSQLIDRQNSNHLTYTSMGFLLVQLEIKEKEKVEENVGTKVKQGRARQRKCGPRNTG
jgi:hypothetical protein